MTGAVSGGDGTVAVSFEFFPPKTDAGAQALLETASVLDGFQPRFMSMTYGAGGTTRDRSLTAAAALRQTVQTPIAGHLTCVGASCAGVEAVARSYWEAGIRHIVALRGDPPKAGVAFHPHPEGYRSAAGLVGGLRRIAPFEISVAAYPETHPEALDARSDLDNLKAKIDAGADRAITQFFFEPETFLRFRDRATAAGITVPIVPGILPIGGVRQALSFAARCGAQVPERMKRQLEGLDDQPEIRALVTTGLAAMLCSTLRAEGVREFHIYALNRAEPAAALCRLLGMQDRKRSFSSQA